MIFAYRITSTGETTLVRAADWLGADSYLRQGFWAGRTKYEPLGAIAPALASAAHCMRFQNKEAFKAWRAEAWSLYVKYAAPTA